MWAFKLLTWLDSSNATIKAWEGRWPFASYKIIHPLPHPQKLKLIIQHHQQVLPAEVVMLVVEEVCSVASWVEVIQAKQQQLVAVEIQVVHRRKMKNQKVHLNHFREKVYLLDQTSVV